jgi:surface antigen
MYKSLSALIVGSLLLVGCEGGNTKEMFGTGLGAIGGGVIGSQFGRGKGNIAATIAGTVIGGFIGNRIGSSLDKADRAHANRAMQNAFEYTPTNASAGWRNPDSGNSGTFVPMRTYQSQAGQYCREVQTTVMVGGRREQAYTTGCRMPDGSWKIN